MIKNKGIWFSALASVMMMTACNSEEDVFSGESNELTGRVMYAVGGSDDGSNPQSRMSYEDNLETNHMDLAWSEGDAFSAFVSGKGVKYDFKIGDPRENGTYTASETFKCDNFPKNVADRTVIYAFYPSSALPLGSDPSKITLSLAEQQQEGYGNTDHLKNCDYMVGRAEYSSASPDSLNFNFKVSDVSGRLASIYRIKMVLPPNVKSVSKIEISCTNALFQESLVTEKKVDITNISAGDEDESMNGEMGTVTLDITNGDVVNGEFVAYVMLFPSKVKERTITVTASDGKTEMSFSDTKGYTEQVDYSRGEFKFINLNLIQKEADLEYNDADFMLWSEELCNTAPTEDDLKKYIAAGAYWDNGSNGDNQQTYTIVRGNGKRITHHSGLWLKKMKYISPDIKPVDQVFVYNGTMKIGRPVDIENYFFLPAAGNISPNNTAHVGVEGVYWSRSSEFVENNGVVQEGEHYPVALFFNGFFASVNRYQTSDQTTKCLPMFGE